MLARLRISLREIKYLPGRMIGTYYAYVPLDPLITIKIINYAMERKTNQYQC